MLNFFSYKKSFRTAITHRNQGGEDVWVDVNIAKDDAMATPSNNKHTLDNCE